MSTSLGIKVISLLVYVAASATVVVVLAEHGAPSGPLMLVTVFG